MSRPAIHPGEILGDELREVGVSAAELARQIRVPQKRISQIIQGKRAISGDTALRLGHWFGNEAQFWLTCSPRTSGAEPKPVSERVWYGAMPTQGSAVDDG